MTITHYQNERTNTAYLRGYAQGKAAYQRDEMLFGYRRRDASKAMLRQAAGLNLAEKLALGDGFEDGAEHESIAQGWETAVLPYPASQPEVAR